MDKLTGSKTTETGTNALCETPLEMATCTKERFRNGSALDVFSRVWALRNSIAVMILVAIPLCNVWGPALWRSWGST